MQSDIQNAKAIKRPQSKKKTNSKTKGKKKPKSNTKSNQKFSKTIKTPKSISTANKYCSPYGNMNQVKKGSCFSPDAVLKLVEGYNAKYPQDRIPIEMDSSTVLSKMKSREMMNMLKEKMNQKATCQDDVCWIDSLILKPSDKTKYKKLLYRPKKPTDWNSNPKTWLNSLDIQNVLNQYEKTHPEFRFIGPSPMDFDTRYNDKNCVCNRLCNLSLQDEYEKGIRKIGIVFNEDKSNQDGSHWVAFFVDLEDRFLFYYDSVGNEMLSGIKRFKKKVLKQGNELFSPKKMKFYQNHFSHQKQNTECGMYSIYFIISMLLRRVDILADPNSDQTGGNEEVKKSDEMPHTMNLKELLHYFTKQRIPDSFVFQYRQHLFGGII